MQTFLSYNGVDFEIPSDVAFSHGLSVDTRESRAHDYTGTAQSLYRLGKLQPNTYSLQFTIDGFHNITDVYQKLLDFDGLVGKLADFTYSGYPFGQVFVLDGQFTITSDAVRGILALTVSFSMRDSQTPEKTRPANTRFS